MRQTYRFMGYSLLMLALVSQLGCGSLAVESKWCDREIVIDGKSQDWEGVLQYFEAKNVSVGRLNDDSFFYMCLIIDQQQLRNQIMAQGLSLWFDPEGGQVVYECKIPLLTSEGMPYVIRAMRGRMGGTVGARGPPVSA